jgi:hypothetical protein
MQSIDEINIGHPIPFLLNWLKRLNHANLIKPINKMFDMISSNKIKSVLVEHHSAQELELGPALCTCVWSNLRGY